MVALSRLGAEDLAQLSVLVKLLWKREQFRMFHFLSAVLTFHLFRGSGRGPCAHLSFV